MELVNGEVRICVHGGHAWVSLLRDVVWVLVHRRSGYSHVGLNLVLRSQYSIVAVRAAGIDMFIPIRLSDAILTHLLMAEVIERMRSGDGVASVLLG